MGWCSIRPEFAGNFYVWFWTSCIDWGLVWFHVKSCRKMSSWWWKLVSMLTDSPFHGRDSSHVRSSKRIVFPCSSWTSKMSTTGESHGAVAPLELRKYPYFYRACYFFTTGRLIARLKRKFLILLPLPELDKPDIDLINHRNVHIRWSIVRSGLCYKITM